MKVKVAQPCPTLCDPMDYSLLDSSVHGILQARTLELVAISFSRGYSWIEPGLNPGLLHCRQILYHLNHDTLSNSVIHIQVMTRVITYQFYTFRYCAKDSSTGLELEKSFEMQILFLQ